MLGWVNERSSPIKSCHHCISMEKTLGNLFTMRMTELLELPRANTTEMKLGTRVLPELHIN